MRKILRQLIEGEDAQDLIEYALLSMFIGVVCVVAWTNISTGIGIAYAGWDGGVQSLSSCTPDPGGLGCP